MDSSLESVSFLVVDDHPNMCQILRTMLFAFGSRQIRTAYNVEDGFARMVKDPFDIVIADYRMKPHDGIEFCNRLRHAPESPNPCVPIILTTSEATSNVVKVALDAGVNEILIKPISAMDLWQRIEWIINDPQPFVRTNSYFGPERRAKPRATAEDNPDQVALI